jgi:hypothetical protein
MISEATAESGDKPGESASLPGWSATTVVRTPLVNLDNS